MQDPMVNPLSAGHSALARGEWEEARVAFEEALGREQAPEALEGLSWACWWLNDAPALFHTRQRAFQQFRKQGDPRGAARMAIWIASDYVDFRGQMAIANGWRQRARRLLQGLGVVPEHGWLILHEGAIAIEIDNDPAVARQLGAEAAEVGRRLGVIDLEMIGMAMQGLALVSEGEIEEGIALLDEAMTAAVGEELEQLFSIGWITCYLIYACERMRDFDRAAQWCQKMEELARRWRFRFWFGICRAHYAGVLTWRGNWQEAEAELEDATRELQRSRPPYAAEGLVRLGELRRRQGRLDEAAELFTQAEGHPLALLGSAQVTLERGDAREAEALLQKFLRQTPEENKTLRAPAYELLVRTYIALGDSQQASASLETLRDIATAVRTQLLLASATFAEGMVVVAAADYQTACYRFEDAVDLFQRSNAPYEASRARIELANVLYALGRLEAAQKVARLALDSAQSIGALREAERAAALLQQLSAAIQDPAGAARSSPLTPREVEVLRLVAQGLSDKEIATRLTISEHTVHRHIANILTKLDVPSRAAAVAFAAQNGYL
ncbi:MAG: helix-turn-helix transcriptional regulator [Anaerolineae bacterium]|nr:MAG: helix-turn-helix transcriptional regulator [Anaerolineae bacterium]